MRVMLALALMLYGEVAGAACPVPLGGNWTIAAGGLACSAYLNSAGRGRATCIDYGMHEPTYTVGLRVSVGPDCHISGKLGQIDLYGRVINLSAFTGVAWGIGALSMFR